MHIFIDIYYLFVVFSVVIIEIISKVLCNRIFGLVELNLSALFHHCEPARSKENRNDNNTCEDK